MRISIVLTYEPLSFWNVFIKMLGASLCDVHTKQHCHDAKEENYITDNIQQQLLLYSTIT